jgi:hypothetical protein
VEGFADQLVLINDEHHRQIALAKAMFDAEIAAVKREMAFAESNFDGALKRLFVGLQGALPESSDVINQFMSQLADGHTEHATKLAQANEEFEREITALRQELVQAHQELAMLRAIDGINRSGRGPNDVLN